MITPTMLRLHVLAACLLLDVTTAFAQAPPRLNIYHFDVNTGDATLIITPGKRGVLIDAGNTGRGLNPILEFLNRAKAGWPPDLLGLLDSDAL
jgi:beta-lactamase superfamily II metal-dependent hydrolase